MYEVIGLEFDYKEVFITRGLGEAPDLFFGFKDIILMQSTGLRDKNDIDIFQGDIIKAFLDEERGYAVDCVWYMAPNWLLANYTTGKLDGSYDIGFWGCGVAIDDFEILGNKYQHPELLQGNIK